MKLIKRNLIKNEYSTLVSKKKGFEPIIYELKTDKNNLNNITFSNKLKVLEIYKYNINYDIQNNNCVILKNFNINNVNNYEKILKILDIKLSNEYRPGIAPRISKSKSGFSFSSTEASKYLPITPHNEMAYSNYRPSIISFWCKQKPLYFGETPLFDCAKIYNDLSIYSPKLLKKINYKSNFNRVFPNYKSKWDYNKSNSCIGGSNWKNAFNTSNKLLINSFCNKIGMRYIWNLDNTLNTSISVNSVLLNNNKKCLQLQTPLLGSLIYDYMLDKFPNRFNNINYKDIIKQGNYSPLIKYTFISEDNKYYELNNKEIYKLMDIIYNNCTIPKWETDDIWLINNISCAHSRMNVSTNNTYREIVTSLGNFIDIRKYNKNPKIKIIRSFL
tara:strand:+ start:2055 stop:3215 length:1161 start_codon:yes stop_codon:yes gene_type:complete